MKKILDYAEQFQMLNHRSPYTSEIADTLGIVKSTVYKYLVAMNDRGMLSYRNGEIVTERTSKISSLTKPAAVLGSVSCGMPQLEEEYIEEYVSLPVSLFGEGEFFILRASGDSMIGAGINSGDMLVIRKQNTAAEGDIVVAGENFGCGSSREQAPSVLKALGVKAVVAKSFARIFYRNSINIGLPVIISKDLYDKVEDGADIDINLSEGWIKTEDETLPCTKLPPYMQNILDHGGLINFLNEGEE